MTPPATTLPELVEQLGRTSSPYERLKIVGRAWSLLRTMTPDQRLAVAAQLGLDQADEVVEAIATRTGGQPSPALLAMIEQAQVKGTAHLPELISDLRDPKRRTARLKEEAAALAGGGVPAATWLPPGAAPPAAPGTPRPAAPGPAAARRPAPQPVATPAPVPAPPVAPPVAAPAPAPPPVAKAAPPAPAPAPPVTQAAPIPEPKPVQAAPPPKPQPKPQPAPAPVRIATDSDLADRLAGISTLTLRFRVFRRSLDEAKGMSTAGLRSILDGFPDGWARRRAMLELLRAGIPAALPDALSLVEALGSERDRLWCLGALTDARDMPAADREALLTVATSPTARRRLERRLGKS